MSGSALWRVLCVCVMATLAGTLGCASDLFPAPRLLSVWGESGSAPGELHQPIGIAVASDGTVFVADTGNDRIQAFGSKGSFLGAFGSRGKQPGEFRRPIDLDIDARGHLYVAEHGGDRVQVFTRAGELLRVVHGEDVDFGLPFSPP